MSLLRTVLEALVNATAKPVANGGSDRIDRLCRETGWVVDERTEEGAVLYFKDPLVRIRKVTLTDCGGLLLLATLSDTKIAAAGEPFEAMAYLLSRNAQLATCAWQASVTDHGEVIFALTYCALVAGLDADTFSAVRHDGPGGTCVRRQDEGGWPSVTGGRGHPPAPSPGRIR